MKSEIKHKDRTDSIVKAAAQLFASQGYHATTTREIARLADVSENTLFRYFDHKEDIFWLALQSCTAEFKDRKDHLEIASQSGTPELALKQLIQAIVEVANNQMGTMRLIAVAFLELGTKAGEFFDENLSPLITDIRRYLESAMNSGQFRKLDTTILTAAILSTIIIHPRLSILDNDSGGKLPNAPDLASTYTKFWLDVLSPNKHPAE